VLQLIVRQTFFIFWHSTPAGICFNLHCGSLFGKALATGALEFSCWRFHLPTVVLSLGAPVLLFCFFVLVTTPLSLFGATGSSVVIHRIG